MILVGTVKDVVKKAVAWSQIKDSPERVLPDYLLAAGRSYLDWIGPSLMRHPDAALLRELAGGADSYAACLVNDESRWSISVISADQVSREIVVDQTLGEEDGMTEVRKHRIAALKAVEPVELFPSSTEEEMMEDTQDATPRDISEEDVFTIGEQEDMQLLREVDKRLSWTYPHQAATQVAASTSVTELKTLLAMQDHQSLQMMEEVEEQSEASVDSEGYEVKDGSSSFKLHLRRPKFMEEKQLTGAERGTVYHTLMQHLPVDGSPVDSQIVEQTLLRLVELQILLPHQAEVIESDQLAGFFNTEPGTELLRAEWVKREIPFIYGLPAHHSPAEWLRNLLPDAGMQTLEEDGKMQASLENETVLVQGIIDCLYEVDGELVLLDYKTDRVLEHRGGLDKLTENYRFQLELYARAIEDILGRKVDRKWLYFLMVDML